MLVHRGEKIAVLGAHGAGIMTLENENKNRVKLLIKLMDVDDEIEEILTNELKSCQN